MPDDTLSLDRLLSGGRGYDVELMALIGLALCLPVIWAWLKGSLLASTIALIPCLTVAFFYVDGLGAYLAWLGRTFGNGSWTTILVIVVTILLIGFGLAFLPRMMWACSRVGTWINAHDQAIYARKAQEKAAREEARFRAMIKVDQGPL